MSRVPTECSGCTRRAIYGGVPIVPSCPDSKPTGRHADAFAWKELYARLRNSIPTKVPTLLVFRRVFWRIYLCKCLKSLAPQDGRRSEHANGEFRRTDFLCDVNQESELGNASAYPQGRSLRPRSLHRMDVRIPRAGKAERQ